MAVEQKHPLRLVFGLSLMGSFVGSISPGRWSWSPSTANAGDMNQTLEGALPRLQRHNCEFIKATGVN